MTAGFWELRWLWEIEETTVKALAPVKRVADYNVQIRMNSDGCGIELANIKMSMKPFDEIALEGAIWLKEAGTVTEMIAVSIGIK